MLSIAEVECPHCGARGRLILPNQGAVLIGPCPRCQEMVAVFCGMGLPLDKHVMTEGSTEEKHAHLMEILTGFLDQAIAQTLSQNEESDSDEHTEIPEFNDETPRGDEMISPDEFNRFKEQDLQLLDDKDYFNTIFKK